MDKSNRKIFRCELCDSIYETEDELNKHLKLHEIAERRGKKEIREPAILHGLEIKEGNVFRVGIGRAFFIVRVKSATDNPNIALCEDIYGHEVTINLAKAFLIQKLNKEDFMRRREAIGRKRGRKGKKA